MAKHYITALAYDKKGRLISVGHNSYVKTHPLQYRLAARSGNPNKIFLHAEVDALIKARGQKVHKLVVMRRGKSGRWLNASPCPSCKLAIKEFGVEKVEHT